MGASPPETSSISSGMPRTLATVGGVFSFPLARLIASHSLRRHRALAIAVGSTRLGRGWAATLTDGRHNAPDASMGLMALAAPFSLSHARSAGGRARPGARGRSPTRHIPQGV